MLLYFFLHDAAFFHNHLAPALAAARRARSFAPCRPVCREALRRSLIPVADDSLVRQVLAGVSYAREFWAALVGELLLYVSVDMPSFQTAPRTLECLLAPDVLGRDVPRPDFAPIQQAHLGTRDLVFAGHHYRPEHAGFNDAGDVERLHEYLAAIDPGTWGEEVLLPLPEFATAEERREELEYVRDWWPSLVAMYGGARAEGRIVICEQF